ncbi:unnamed protein product [Acanthoscelides obtectus]|uniref:Uncharacterized protein n=1 Tax=Acanthoscelides obtectus TaxID=200917 RepID=A0A9P0KEU7_ACAOB|nr:unnamed protein product [Acanthoscelides obtectus]CAK1656417.1 hypothetical protein AOBTE_LOCUS19700 [Acanthoscelides obtectus]
MEQQLQFQNEISRLLGSDSAAIRRIHFEETTSSDTDSDDKSLDENYLNNQPPPCDYNIIKDSVIKIGTESGKNTKKKKNMRNFQLSYVTKCDTELFSQSDFPPLFKGSNLPNTDINSVTELVSNNNDRFVRHTATVQLLCSDDEDWSDGDDDVVIGDEHVSLRNDSDIRFDCGSDEDISWAAIVGRTEKTELKENQIGEQELFVSHNVHHENSHNISKTYLASEKNKKSPQEQETLSPIRGGSTIEKSEICYYQMEFPILGHGRCTKNKQTCAMNDIRYSNSSTNEKDLVLSPNVAELGESRSNHVYEENFEYKLAGDTVDSNSEFISMSKHDSNTNNKKSPQEQETLSPIRGGSSIEKSEIYYYQMEFPILGHGRCAKNKQRCARNDIPYSNSSTNEKDLVLSPKVADLGESRSNHVYEENFEYKLAGDTVDSNSKFISMSKHDSNINNQEPSTTDVKKKQIPRSTKSAFTPLYKRSNLPNSGINSIIELVTNNNDRFVDVRFLCSDDDEVPFIEDEHVSLKNENRRNISKKYLASEKNKKNPQEQETLSPIRGESTIEKSEIGAFDYCEMEFPILGHGRYTKSKQRCARNNIPYSNSSTNEKDFVLSPNVAEHGKCRSNHIYEENVDPNWECISMCKDDTNTNNQEPSTSGVKKKQIPRKEVQAELSISSNCSGSLPTIESLIECDKYAQKTKNHCAMNGNMNKSVIKNNTCSLGSSTDSQIQQHKSNSTVKKKKRKKNKIQNDLKHLSGSDIQDNRTFDKPATFPILFKDNDICEFEYEPKYIYMDGLPFINPLYLAYNSYRRSITYIAFEDSMTRFSRSDIPYKLADLHIDREFIGNGYAEKIKTFIHSELFETFRSQAQNSLLKKRKRKRRRKKSHIELPVNCCPAQDDSNRGVHSKKENITVPETVLSEHNNKEFNRRGRFVSTSLSIATSMPVINSAAKTYETDEIPWFFQFKDTSFTDISKFRDLYLNTNMKHVIEECNEMNISKSAGSPDYLSSIDTMAQKYGFCNVSWYFHFKGNFTTFSNFRELYLNTNMENVIAYKNTKKKLRRKRRREVQFPPCHSPIEDNYVYEPSSQKEYMTVSENATSELNNYKELNRRERFVSISQNIAQNIPAIDSAATHEIGKISWYFQFKDNDFTDFSKFRELYLNTNLTTVIETNNRKKRTDESSKPKTTSLGLKKELFKNSKKSNMYNFYGSVSCWYFQHRANNFIEFCKFREIYLNRSLDHSFQKNCELRPRTIINSKIRMRSKYISPFDENTTLTREKIPTYIYNMGNTYISNTNLTCEGIVSYDTSDAIIECESVCDSNKLCNVGCGDVKDPLKSGIATLRYSGIYLRLSLCCLLLVIGSKLVTHLYDFFLENDVLLCCAMLLFVYIMLE